MSGKQPGKLRRMIDWKPQKGGVEVWGLDEESAWIIFGLLTAVTGPVGIVLLMVWYHRRDQQKKLEEAGK